MGDPMKRAVQRASEPLKTLCCAMDAWIDKVLRLTCPQPIAGGTIDDVCSFLITTGKMGHSVSMALVNFRSLATQLRVKDHSLSRQTFDIFALTMRKAAASMNSHAALQSITTQIAEIENIFAQELDTKSDTNIQVTEEEKVASVKTDYNTLASAPAGSDLSEAEEKDESHQSDPGISSVFEESGCNHSDADFVDAFSSLDLNDAEAKCEDNNDGGSGGPIVKTSTIQKLKAEDNTILRRAARITICKTRSGQNDLAGVELAFVKYNGWNTHFKRRDSGEVIRLSNQRTIRVAYFE